MKKHCIFLVVLIATLLITGCSGAEKNKVTFDLDSIKISSSPTSSQTACFLPKTNPHYSTIMQRVSKNGLIVAGYATGLREKAGAFTVTTFEIKDVFYGTTKNKTIKIKERYELVQENGINYIYYSGQESKLYNGDLYLLFLIPDKDGSYFLECEYLNLMPDYKEFNNDYVKSLCNFYRGDTAEYYSKTGEWSQEYEVSYVNDKGEKINETVPRDFSVKMCPSKRISDQALLDELEENLLVRTAMEYKIAIWPYGHKNFDVTSHRLISDDMLRCSQYFPEGQIGYPWSTPSENAQ